MKAATIPLLALLLAASGAVPTAQADTTTATCELKKEGEVKKNASGTCTFSQRQGYVDIRLANGAEYSLSPLDQPNEYKDAKGRKVNRTVSGDTQVYKWDDKKITVTFDGGGGGGEQVGDTPADLNDLVHGKKVGGEVDDEMASRGWKPVKTTGEDPDLYSYWSKGSRCVVVHFDAKRKVQSVATGVAADCKE